MWGVKVHHKNKFKEAGKSHTSASPYNYYGRTHDREMSAVIHAVGPHAGGHKLRRGGHVHGPTKHGLHSWSDRGHGVGASYKD